MAVADREAVHEDLYQDWNRPGEELFQVHAIEREGVPAMSRKLSRGKALASFAQAAPCRVGMEARGSSHYWAREIRASGHEVVGILPLTRNPMSSGAERCERRGRNPRGHVAPRHAVRADQERGPTASMLQKTGNRWSSSEPWPSTRCAGISRNSA